MKYVAEKFMICVIRDGVPITVSDSEEFVTEFINSNKRLDELCGIESEYTSRWIPMCIPMPEE